MRTPIHPGEPSFKELSELRISGLHAKSTSPHPNRRERGFSNGKRAIDAALLCTLVWRESPNYPFELQMLS